MSTEVSAARVAPKKGGGRRRLSLPVVLLIIAGALALVSLVRLISGANDVTSVGQVSGALELAVPIGLYQLVSLMLFNLDFWCFKILGAVPNEVIGIYAAALNGLVQPLRTGDQHTVLSRWRALAPSALGSTVEWERANTRTRGTTLGIVDEGALLVRSGEATERIVAGEVRWL